MTRAIFDGGLFGPCVYIIYIYIYIYVIVAQCLPASLVAYIPTYRYVIYYCGVSTWAHYYHSSLESSHLQVPRALA
jgi:hypothetical protein